MYMLASNFPLDPEYEATNKNPRINISKAAYVLNSRTSLLGITKSTMHFEQELLLTDVANTNL
jgi:hypothetical protein